MIGERQLPSEVFAPVLQVGFFGPGRLPAEDSADAEASANRVLDAIATCTRAILASDHPGRELFEGEPELRWVSDLSSDIERRWADAAVKKGWVLCPLPSLSEPLVASSTPADFAIAPAGGAAARPSGTGPSRCDILLGQSDILIAVRLDGESPTSGDAAWLRRAARDRGLPILDVGRDVDAVVTSAGVQTDWRDGLRAEIGRVLLPGYDPRRRTDAEARRAVDEFRLFVRTRKGAPFVERLYRSYESLLLLGSRRVIEQQLRSLPLPVAPSPPACESAGASAFDAVQTRLAPAREHAERLAGGYAALYRTAAVLRIALGLVAILGLFLAFYYPNVLRVLASLQTHSENEILYPAVLEFSAAINGVSVRRLGYATEMTAILCILVISFVSERRRWHHRFAAYRYIAEHLRQMPLLLPIGETIGRARAEPFASTSVDWPGWYIRMVSRSLGTPPPRMTADFVAAAKRHLRCLLADQIGFYESKSRKFDFISRRLDAMATGCFYLGVVTALLRLITAFFFADRWEFDILLNLGCLFFPSLAPFFLGLRGYGEYPKLAQRYAAMATNLRTAAAALERDDIRFADLAETSRRVAAMMLEEVGEWNVLIKGRGITRF